MWVKSIRYGPSRANEAPPDLWELQRWAVSARQVNSSKKYCNMFDLFSPHCVFKAGRTCRWCSGFQRETSGVLFWLLLLVGGPCTPPLRLAGGGNSLFILTLRLKHWFRVTSDCLLNVFSRETCVFPHVVKSSWWCVRKKKCFSSILLSNPRADSEEIGC